MERYKSQAQAPGQNAHEDANRTVKLLEDKLEKAEALADQFRTKATEAEGKVSQLEAQAKSLQAQLDSAGDGGHAEVLTGDKKKLEERLMQSENDVRSLKAKLDQAEREIERLEAELG